MPARPAFARRRPVRRPSRLVVPLLLATLSALPQLRGTAAAGTIPQFGAPFVALNVGADRGALGDFNGDGHPDLLVTETSWRFELLAGDGRGAFSEPLAIEQEYDAPAAADLNEDGKTDAVLSERITGPSTQYVIVRGQASGGLAVVGSVPTTQGLAGKWLGDVNADGHADLVHLEPGRLVVRLGDGHFGFGARQVTGLPLTTYDQFRMADLNRDGHPDAFVYRLGVNSPALFVAGTGSGTFFAPPAPLPLGEALWDAQLGDFNGDLAPDLASSSYGIDRIGLRLGDGGGGFAAPLFTPLPSTPDRLALADFDSDGRLDLAVTSDSLRVLPGQGDGSFATSVVTYLNQWGLPLAGDVNHDNQPDLVVLTNSQQDESPVLLGRGDFSFGETRHVDISPTTSGAFHFDDLTGDGRPDLIVSVFSQTGPPQFEVRRGLGAGLFAPPVTYTDPPDVGNLTEFVVRDFNGDGAPDLAALCGQTHVHVRLNAGGGVLGAASSLIVPVINGTGRLRGQDLDGDGDPELVVTAGIGSLVILKGMPGGSFQNIQQPGVGANTINGLAVGLLTADAIPDIVVTCSSTAGWRVLPGLGGGLFGAPIDLPVMSTTQTVAVADMDADGRDDLVLNAGGQPSVWRQNPAGIFTRTSSPDVWAGFDGLQLADVDADGHLDLLVGCGSSVAVLAGDGACHLGAPVHYGMNGWPVAFEVADLDWNGSPDVGARLDVGGRSVCGLLLNRAGAVAEVGGGPPIHTAAPLRIQLARNPGRHAAAFQLGGTARGPASFDLFDASGRLVRRLWSAESMPEAGVALHWDGMNETGTACPPGLYFTRLRVGGEQASSKLAWGGR